MSEKNSWCIICNEGSTSSKRLTNNPALEKYYHSTCLRSYQRTVTPVFHSNVLVIRTVCDEQFLFLSVSVCVLANNALRAHHASAHAGVSTNGLPDICLIFFEMIMLSCLK